MAPRFQVVPPDPGHARARAVLRLLRAWTDDMECIARASYPDDSAYLIASRAVSRMRVRQIATVLDLGKEATS